MNTLTTPSKEAALLEEFFTKRDTLRDLLKEHSKSVFRYGKNKRKRLIFVVDKGSEIERTMKLMIKELFKLLADYKKIGGSTRRATWIPNYIGPDIRQVNFTCSPAHSSQSISAKRAIGIIHTYDPTFKLPAEKGKYRLVKPTGLDYRAKIWDLADKSALLRPFGFIVIIEDEKLPITINLPSDRPRKPRSDSRILNEKPIFSIPEKIWIFRDK